MENEEKILRLLEQILEAVKQNSEIQQDILNLFKQYDTEEILNDEELRMINEG